MSEMHAQRVDWNSNTLNAKSSAVQIVSSACLVTSLVLYLYSFVIVCVGVSVRVVQSF